MEVIHKALAAGRWYELSLVEQMANIGSDVFRCISWREKGREDYAQRAFERALELFDLTLADVRWRGRLREVCRAREVVCDYVAGDNEWQTTAESLNRYFLGFAILARREHEQRSV